MDHKESLEKEQIRRQRQREKVYLRVMAEYSEEQTALKRRSDYFSEYEYFCALLSEPAVPSKITQRTGKPTVGLFCVQVPWELFAAFDLQAIKLCSGAYSAQRMVAANVPVLMCPMLKSYMGSLELMAEEDTYAAVIIPTTCDWVVKIPELAKNKFFHFHYMELPHVKESERGLKRWLEEVYVLQQFLSKLTGKKLSRQCLREVMEKFDKAWGSLQNLIGLRRRGFVPDVWFSLIMNAFMLDDVAVWQQHVEKVLLRLRTDESKEQHQGIFLTGSPIFFPNFKLYHLLEQAGMFVQADDLCSSERAFLGAVVCEDTSLHGMLKALAERYHRGCSCPTYADNERRVNTILRVTGQYGIKGVVFHVLKGCHPYDIESFTLEKILREKGLKFLKIETDYMKEDSQNLLTRLEAFRQTLR